VLDPDRKPYPPDEIRARRILRREELERRRRFRIERIRAWVILLGGVGFIVLLAAHHNALAFGLVLAVVLAAMYLRRIGSR
jgi:hypothetical protein